jgi:hypothetical protein
MKELGQGGQFLKGQEREMVFGHLTLSSVFFTEIN